MQKILLLIICTLSLHAIAQQHINPEIDLYAGNRFYHISSSSNKNLLLFLHGGIGNHYFTQSYDQITLNYLIEENDSFLHHATDNNFDLILPISDANLNWLDKPQESFAILKDYINSLSQEYQEIYISGFSDGGTGSYKIFYDHPDYFDGLVVFNGYPQHSNFYKHVEHSAVNHKKVILLSTYEDEIIPYEFLLTEYCAQKRKNANTYFYLAHGGHSFQSYQEKDFHELFLILTSETSNSKTEPIQGYVKNDQLITLYPFRKKIVRKYNFGKATYEDNIVQIKKYQR